MKCWHLALLLGAGLAQANEFPRPTERLAVLPGEEWIPRPRPRQWSLAGERPLPELPIDLAALSAHLPWHPRLASELALCALRAAELRQWALESALEVHLVGLSLRLHARQDWWRLGESGGRGTPQWEIALAFHDGPWRLAGRQRLRGPRSLQDLALQWSQGALQFGLGRESSPYGADARWQFGAATRLAAPLRVGAILRGDEADLCLDARRGALRMELAIAASGALRGGVAWRLGWSR